MAQPGVVIMNPHAGGGRHAQAVRTLVDDAEDWRLLATDGNGMIKDYVYDTAATHDSKHIDQLIDGEIQEVFADSAYMDKHRKARLENDGVFCGIIERRVRGQAELTKAQKAHNRLCAWFRAFVEHPFAWIKRAGGFARTRYRGLRRNALDFGLGAIAYNFERSMSLKT